MDQQDTMHHPIPVLYSAFVGLLLNALCYTLIGGYTFHQGSFLHLNASGDVVLDRVVVAVASSASTENSSSCIVSEEQHLKMKAGKSMTNNDDDNSDSRNSINGRFRWHAMCRDLCSK